MKISTKIFIAFFVILLFFSITTVVNFKQAQEVKENTQWVENSQLVIRHTARLQRNMVDMESDLRGFLLTKDDMFISNFDSLFEDNFRIEKDLRALIRQSKYQVVRLDTIMSLHKRWKTNIAEPLVKRELRQEEGGTTFSLLDRNKDEKRIRRIIVDKFREINNYEYNLREKRRARLNASVASTREISIILTIVSIIIGLAVAFYVVKIITNRIFHMVNLADGIANGNFDIKVKDTSEDELSNLSHSLNSMAKRLKENILELERKNNELDQFAYIVSHDLKAPLRGIENITMWIQEDLREELSPKMKEYMELMVGRTKRMENLIQGVLDLSKAGRIKQNIELVDVKELVKEIIEMLAPPPTFKFTVPDKTLVLRTERISLQQVFSNLISNCIKYHDKKDGKVEIGWKEENEYYQFYVKDDGPGISPKYHDKIFIVFQTLRERDAFESTGVGLAIVKKILSEKNCSIKVFSDEGKGANFVFTWPKSES
jgi:signal transduction histidine kinase